MDTRSACQLMLIFLLLGSTELLHAQDTLAQPVFSSFQGIVYEIPVKRMRKGGYGNDIPKLPVYDTIHWENINFPDSDVGEVPFPGVPLKQSFGIIFTGSVRIPKTGWYQFATNSDDGTILWIDGKKVVDNDRDHRMRLRVDTIALRAGNYPVRLWYYQAFPTRYGVQLDGRYYRDFRPEEIAVPAKDTLVLSQEQLLFAHNSSDLLVPARHLLDSLATSLVKNRIKRMTITGHTDNTGTPAYNRQLSLARAQAVRKVMERYFADQKVSFSVSGQGETMPVASNLTEDGRTRNRRVVIEIEYY